ncbi:hypothetical protein EQG49_03220 [Periweissella cryptocerci]|uniref:Uncharacterized protein n=1 Tax=Periweissella cryptocerci TaxID=2506420 RepID=A0A4P6YSB7_9LACO|nr:hypothetical protein [Periweissella cryptocerci]QBO35536.1 hypothetical protein EQG49_03220 [Periweissella cryptocerci]
MKTSKLYVAVKQEKLMGFDGNEADIVILVDNPEASGNFIRCGQMALYKDNNHIKKAVIYDGVDVNWARSDDFYHRDIFVFTNEIANTAELAILAVQGGKLMNSERVNINIAKLIAEIRQDQAMIMRKQAVIYQNMAHFLSK